MARVSVKGLWKRYGDTVVLENINLDFGQSSPEESFIGNWAASTGEGISTQAREIYELVSSAQEQGVAAVRAGPTGREVDAVARAVIERAGHGENFGHGLGHGVGMEVHERPRLSRTAGEEQLRAGNVVTVEPGVYLPGRLGVRIEDLVVVGEEGQEVLSGLSKELTVIS